MTAIITNARTAGGELQRRKYEVLSVLREFNLLYSRRMVLPYLRNDRKERQGAETMTLYSPKLRRDDEMTPPDEEEDDDLDKETTRSWEEMRDAEDDFRLHERYDREGGKG